MSAKRSQGHFQIGPANKCTGPTLPAGEVRPAAVLHRTGHPQGAGFLVLTQRCITASKSPGHVQLHHPLVRRQLIQRTKITASAVRTAHVLGPIALGHELFPQSLPTQTTRSHRHDTSRNHHTPIKQKHSTKTHKKYRPINTSTPSCREVWTPR